MKKRMIMAVLLALLFLSGCKAEGEPTRVVLTAGLRDDEVFRIETMSCSLAEAMTVLVNMQSRYETTFGEQIWDVDLGNVSLENNVKDNALSHLARIKSMNLLAKRQGVSLDEEESGKAKEAAIAYYESLNDAEKEVLQISLEEVEAMYREYALADKIYHEIIKDINPEISDDEARTITVEQIYIRTYANDGTGTRIEYSEKDKLDAYNRARKVLLMAKQPEADFTQLVLDYSEGDKGTFSFGKGETQEAFEEAAFNLETGQISDIIETADGYYIIKCISTFDKEETDANKVLIVEKRKEEVFGEEYESFAKDLIYVFNEKLWESVTLPKDDSLQTGNFFVVYDRYFAE